MSARRRWWHVHLDRKPQTITRYDATWQPESVTRHYLCRCGARRVRADLSRTRLPIELPGWPSLHRGVVFVDDTGWCP